MLSPRVPLMINDKNVETLFVGWLNGWLVASWLADWR